MRVEVTPMMTSKQKAPPIGVKTYDGKRVLNLKTFDNKILFVQFLVFRQSNSCRGTANGSKDVQRFERQAFQSNCFQSASTRNLPTPWPTFEKNNIGIPNEKGKSEPIGSFGFTSGVEDRTFV